jgi:N4-gp56 family major capsid protein
MDVIANQMARSLNYQITKKMSTQCYRHRIDNDTTYIKTGTASAAGASATTTLRDAGVLTQADDAWIGGYITFTSPETENYDVTKLVSASVQADAEVTFAAVNHNVAATTKYSITVGTNLAASDKLTTAGILYCSALHEKMETEKFDGGMFRMFIGPEQHQDLWSDTTFLNSAIYDKSERFEKYKAGTWFDTEFLVISDQYREDTDGTENAAGAVYVSPMFGKNSYTVIRYGNPGGSGKFATKFMIVDTPDSGNLRNSAKYMSWKGTYAAGVTRATSIIGLMTGATSLNVTV